MIVACPDCEETIESVMQVHCRACGAALRPGELWGGVIRRKAEPATAALLSPDDL